MGDGKRGSKVEHFNRVTLPGLREGHIPAACGWKVDLVCLEASGSTREVKERSCMWVQEGKRELKMLEGPQYGLKLLISCMYLLLFYL